MSFLQMLLGIPSASAAPVDLTADYLVVAGGGASGGSWSAGGGGACG